jgi:hypothetical protein
VVRDALFDEGPLEERVRWPKVGAPAIDLTPVPATTDEDEAVVDAVFVRPAGSSRLPAVVVDDAHARCLTEHREDSFDWSNLSVELRSRHRPLSPSQPDTNLQEGVAAGR